jgi:hypothetical protein
MRPRRPIAIVAAAMAVVVCSILAPVLATAFAQGAPARAQFGTGPVASTAAATAPHVAQARTLATTALAAEQEAAAEAGYGSKARSKKKAAKSRGDETAQAQAILASLQARYPRYLEGVTVSFGNASGYQAVAYYTSGRIVISPKHRASLDRILKHEVWHIIDWRDNGRIDWREKVPPANASAYR